MQEKVQKNIHNKREYDIAYYYSQNQLSQIAAKR